MFDLLWRSMAVLGLSAMVTATPVVALAQAEPPVIAVAASVQFAATEIAAAFMAETGIGVTLVFGSTGNFVSQIREGAPFQMLVAADEKSVLDLAAEGLTRDAGTVYAVGRIVMITRLGGPLAADGTLESLRAALEAGEVTHFAIANPEHAPYGARAMEALQHAGLWETVQPLLVLGENVAQAAQFATSGNAQGGITAYSLALSAEVAALGHHDLIPAEWHQPLTQRMALLPSAGPEAAAFHDYMNGPAARAIMARYGFDFPA